MGSRVVPRYSGMGQTLWTVGPIQYTLVHSYGVPCSPTVQRDGTDTLDSGPHTVHIGTFLWGPVQSHGTAGWDRHSGQWAPYSTHWYIPMGSRVVPRYSGMGQTLWTVGPIQYTLVHSYGVPCSPTVQRDGTDTLDSGPHSYGVL